MMNNFKLDSSNNYKSEAIRKLLLLAEEQLHKSNFFDVQQVIVRAIAIFESFPKKWNEPDLTLELKEALENIKKIIPLLSKVVDGIEITKISLDKDSRCG